MDTDNLNQPHSPASVSRMDASLPASNASAGTIQTLDLDTIRIDGGTQSRVAIDTTVVADYREVIDAGGALPPVTVFFDGAAYWLADGFHRFHAHAAAGRVTVKAEVPTGTVRDAMMYSFGANAVHGLRRSGADKRRAVLAMLHDPEWTQWSDRHIATTCAVSNRFVSNLRRELAEGASGTKVTDTAPDVHVAGREQVTVNVHSEDETGEPVEHLCTFTDVPRAVQSPEVQALTPTRERTYIKHGQVRRMRIPDATPRMAPTVAPAQPKTEREQQAEEVAQDAHGDFDPIAELEVMQRDMEALQAQIKAAEADDLKAEAMKYQRIATVAQQRQNELMSTVNDRERDLTNQTRWLRAIGEELDELRFSVLPMKVRALKERVRALEKVGASPRWTIDSGATPPENPHVD